MRNVELERIAEDEALALRAVALSQPTAGRLLALVEEFERRIGDAKRAAGGEGPPALEAALGEVGRLSAEVCALEHEKGHLIQAVEIEKEQRYALQARVEELEEQLGEANSRLVAESLARLAEGDAQAPDVAPAPVPDVPVVPRVKVVERKPKEKADAGPGPSPGEPVSQFGDRKGGLVGQSPRSQEPRRFRLIGLTDGEPNGYVDEGTASELAKRNGMRSSLIYKWASGKTGSKKWKVERL